MAPSPPSENGPGAGRTDGGAGRATRESDLMRELDEVTARRPVEPRPDGGAPVPAADDATPQAPDGVL